MLVRTRRWRDGMGTTFTRYKPIKAVRAYGWSATPWPLVLSFPALLFLLLAFTAPLALLIGTSLVSRTGDVTLEIYGRVLSDGYYWQMIGRTIKVSVASTVATIVLAYPVALFMRQASTRSRLIVGFIILSPLLTSVVVRTLGWVVLLSKDGVINSFLTGVGLPPTQWIYNDIGIVIGLTHVYFGYMVIALLASIIKIEDALLLAASDLGASKWQAFRHIVIPQSLPGLVAGSVLVFSMCASSYATPRLLGGSASKVLGTEIYDVAINYLEWKEAAALALILCVVVAVSIWLGGLVAESGKGRGVFK